MKNLKIYFSIILTAMILTISTAVLAYDGTSIVFNDKIFMPESLVDGKGEIEVTRDVTNYTMYYEFVEMDNSTYKKIVKLKDELKVAEYYNIWEDLNGNTQDSNYQRYVEAYNSYKNKYGTTVDDYTDSHIDVVESQIVALWASYTNNWTTASGNTVSIDLNSFSGTKDFVLWVKVKTANNEYYFADVYEVTGTKSENNNSNNNNNSNTTNTEKNIVEDNKNNINNNSNTINNNVSNNNSTGKTESKNTMNDSTTSSTKTLPKTGISNIIIVSVFIATIVAGISYVKYRKIK